MYFIIITAFTIICNYFDNLFVYSNGSQSVVHWTHHDRSRFTGTEAYTIQATHLKTGWQNYEPLLKICRYSKTSFWLHAFPASLLLHTHILIVPDPVGLILTAMPPLFLGQVCTHLLILGPWVSNIASNLHRHFWTSSYLKFRLLHTIVHLCHHTAFYSQLLISCCFLRIMLANLPLWWKESGLNKERKCLQSGVAEHLAQCTSSS